MKLNPPATLPDDAPRWRRQAAYAADNAFDARERLGEAYVYARCVRCQRLRPIRDMRGVGEDDWACSGGCY